MTTFEHRLQTGPPLVLDGALGTELARHGIQLSPPEWSATALESHPDTVQAIHTAYIAAGADIITTNTFRTHARNLGTSDRAKRLTTRAVQLAIAARQAASRADVFIAGSVAPLEDCYSPGLTPSPDECQREHAELITNLAQAGVDVLLLETMNTRHEAEAAARAAAQTGLPFMVSLLLGEGFTLLSGEPLAETVAALSTYGPAALLLNCIPTRHITPALDKLRGLAAVPIGAYANMDNPPGLSAWAAAEALSPTIYCENAKTWLRVGARIVGSCCGSTPAHTAALHELAQHHPS